MPKLFFLLFEPSINKRKPKDICSLIRNLAVSSLAGSSVTHYTLVWDSMDRGLLELSVSKTLSFEDLISGEDVECRLVEHQ